MLLSQDNMYAGINVARYVPTRLLPIGNFADVLDVRYRCATSSTKGAAKFEIPGCRDLAGVYRLHSNGDIFVC